MRLSKLNSRTIVFLQTRLIPSVHFNVSTYALLALST
jgi:hypothetical protein